MVNRISLEKVKGVYQGAVFPFRKGFSSGVLRMCWGADGSMFVGMTARGWGSGGGAPYGLQRLVWNGKMPFEIKTIAARPDGFELEFTTPVDKRAAKAAASYQVRSFTYKYHRQYGSPIINSAARPLKAITVSADGRKVRLVLDSLKEGYIHEIAAAGVRSAANEGLLHNTGFYTLNKVPDGPKLAITAENRVKIVQKQTARHAPVKSPSSKGPATPSANKRIPDYADVKPLLTQYTCLSCHDPVKRLVGPPYAEVARRRYPIDKLIRLIHNPDPTNWPDYATPMPPMPDIPASDMMKIATWINSLAQ
jgi:cytochrome c551/c552